MDKYRLPFAVVVLVGTCVGNASAQPPKKDGGKRGDVPEFRALPARWEFRIVTGDQLAHLGNNNPTEGLNKLGEEGWELVTTAPLSGIEYYFKRPKGKLTPPTTPPAKEKARSSEDASSLERAREVTNIFALKRAKAVETMNMLLELFGGRTGKDVRIAADPRTNSLIVMGPASTVTAIEAVLRRLDETGEEKK